MKNLKTGAIQCPVQKGFTFIELVVVIAVIALLAGVLIPNVTSVTKDAKASKILQLYDSLRTACERYYIDMGSTPREYSGSSYNSATYHQLSLAQTNADWKGPYIDHPLSTGDNPFSTTVYLYNAIGSHSSNGFDLNGDGTDDATGSGNYLVLWGIPSDTAQFVDTALDKGNLGSDWKTSGRVEYVSSEKKLAILIIDA
jgi:general secretion pathway protein G